MRLHLALAILPLLLSAQLTFASDDSPNVNFDQGVDAGAILQRARELAAKQLTPISPVERKLLKVKKREKAVVGPGQYQPVSPFITGSAAYPLGVNLRLDPKYFALDAVVLKPLETEWTNINSVRSNLLSQASGWEGENEQLYRDGQQLDRDLAVLERRQADLNTEIAQYNQACTTRPLPPDEYQQCVSWRDSLIRRKSQLESDITQYNGRVNSWNQRSSAIFGRRGTLVGLIEAWERRIQNWIETVKKAIAAQCRPLKEIDVDPKLARVPTGGITQPFDARPIFENEPKDAPACPIELSWFLQAEPDVPGISIGIITSKSGRSTTFISGNGTGRGTLYVKDELSPHGAPAIIYVYNPAK